MPHFPGSATAEGTARFAGRFPNQKFARFFRQAQGLTVSSIGIGTYLGARDEVTDRGYTEAVQTAISHGVNCIDTSLNYRHQHSERSIGAALREAIGGGKAQRDELLICTKAGYLVPGASPEVAAEDLAGGSHSVAPGFLADQLGRSRDNLGLETIDVFYLHNPETQLNHISPDDFYQRIRAAFQYLEGACEKGLIRFYGTATWDGYRRKAGAPEGLSLARLSTIAHEIAGEQHHFRFIQLPFNIAMPEAYALGPDGRNVLQEAEGLGLTVVASASLLQARLSRGLPEEMQRKMPGTATDAQRALQFTRSTPGITVALVGMSQAAHVAENLALGNTPPLTPSQYRALYKQG